jgi:hypothetical protein
MNGCFRHRPSCSRPTARRILGGTTTGVRPSRTSQPAASSSTAASRTASGVPCLIPSMIARTKDIQRPLSLRESGVPFLGLGPRLRRRPDVSVPHGVRVRPLLHRGSHRPDGRVARESAGRRTPPNARRPEGQHRHDGRRRVRPGSRTDRVPLAPEAPGSDEVLSLPRDMSTHFP